MKDYLLMGLFFHTYMMLLRTQASQLFVLVSCPSFFSLARRKSGTTFSYCFSSCE